MYLLPRFSVTLPHLRTNVACTPNMVYVIECNVCRCATTGFLDVSLCTNRHCFQGHKADSCSYGDILRFGSQLCSCSDISYFIDRQCIKLDKEIVQNLETEELLKLVEIGKSWRRLTELQVDSCKTEMTYTVDCNQCICNKGNLACSQQVCDSKPSLRHEKKPQMIQTLPELKSDDDTCNPGQKYRYKCNSCVCTSEGYPSCTTMICLEDFVLDANALRSVFSAKT